MKFSNATNLGTLFIRFYAILKINIKINDFHVWIRGLANFHKKPRNAKLKMLSKYLTLWAAEGNKHIRGVIYKINQSITLENQ